MEFTEELRLSILSLWHEAHSKDMDSFCKLLKEKAEKLGISYNVLLQLVFDKKYLFFEVLPKVEEIDRKVSDLQKQIEKLKDKEDILEYVEKFLEQLNVQDYVYLEATAIYMYK